jgi:hypothetical protein
MYYAHEIDKIILYYICKKICLYYYLLRYARRAPRIARKKTVPHPISSLDHQIITAVD